MDRFHSLPPRERIGKLFRWVEVADEIRRDCVLEDDINEHLLRLENYVWQTLKMQVYQNLHNDPPPSADDIPF